MTKRLPQIAPICPKLLECDTNTPKSVQSPQLERSSAWAPNTTYPSSLTANFLASCCHFRTHSECFGHIRSCSDRFGPPEWGGNRVAHSNLEAHPFPAKVFPTLQVVWMKATISGMRFPTANSRKVRNQSRQMLKDWFWTFFSTTLLVVDDQLDRRSDGIQRINVLIVATRNDIEC